jgi:general secretion pathway protein F
VGWSHVLADVTGIAMIVIGFLVGFLVFLSTIGKLAAPSFCDKIILRIPFYKDLVLAKNNFVILYGLSRLVGTGVPMDQALHLQAVSAPKGSMRDDLEAAHKAIKAGRPWAPAMKNLHPTDKAALSTSQDREQVSRALEAMSHQYQIIFAQRVATLAPVLQLLAVTFLVLSGVILFGMTVIPILQLSGGGLTG